MAILRLTIAKMAPISGSQRRSKSPESEAGCLTQEAPGAEAIQEARE